MIATMYRTAAFAMVLSVAAASAADFRPFWLSITCDRNPATGLAFKQSRTVKSDVVVSSTGQRAWSEVAVVGFAEGGCSNTSRLFIDRRQVYRMEPNEQNGDANAMAPIAWSADGRLLAVEFVAVNYGTDFFPLSIMVYDTHSGSVSEPEWYEGVKKLAPKDCNFMLQRVTRFDRRGRIHFVIADDLDDPGNDHPTRCGFGRGKSFSLDPASGRVEAAP